MNENDEYAFPYAAEWGCQNGMTLRDYFAGQALAGLLANNQCALGRKGFMKSVVESSYQTADAMLAARKS